jgi:hypothetical protein
MAVAIQMDFKGATLDQYDEVVAKMGFSPAGAGAKGGLFHWVTKTADGIRVTDVWDSKAQFEKFAQDEIGPISAAVGVPAPPELQFFEVHNHLTAG